MDIGIQNRLRELADRLIAPGPKASHVSASECHELSEGVHELLDLKRAAEAEDLRSGIEKLTREAESDALGSRTVSVHALQQLLDEVDARDCLAYLEARDERLAKALADLQGSHGAEHALRAELDHVRGERDEARRDLVKAMQTLELNAAAGPTLYLCDKPSLCACCGRTRKDGRRDRGWKNVVADVNAQRRFSVRIAFCAKCFEYLEARAAKHIGKEQREQPGELEEAGRG